LHFLFYTLTHTHTVAQGGMYDGLRCRTG